MPADALLPMIRSYVIAALILLGGGAAITPLKEHIVEVEESSRLLPGSLSYGETDGEVHRLEQQLSFVALGGLRSLVAAFLAIDAHEYFMYGRWDKLEERYRQIVALAPYNVYYWDVGAWHLALNAAGACQFDKNLSEQERQFYFSRYYEKGRKFLLEGISNNPDDWFLYKMLGDLYVNIYRFPDNKAALDAYSKAYELNGPRKLRYLMVNAMSGVPGMEKEAYEAVKRLVLTREHKVPATESLLYAFQILLDIPREERVPINQIFLSPKDASMRLVAYYRQEKGYPKAGIEEAYKILQPYAKETSWSVMPHSDLERLSFLRKMTEPS